MALTLSTSAASVYAQRVAENSRRVQQPQSTGDLVSLAMGEPDFDTPRRIVDAAHRAALSGRTHYSPLRGEPALREAIAGEIASRHGIPCAPDQVLITQGGTGGLGAGILGLVSPGDRVVIPDPTYSLYADLIHMAGGEVVPVPLREDLHWDLPALEEVLAGAALFVFCNPGNPTGIVHSEEELRALAAMLAGTETLVISDEAYEPLVFTERPFASALGVEGLPERTLLCHTFSKSHAMTGWRVGYLAGPTELIEAAARIHNTFNGSVNTFVQDAALTALTECGDDVVRMRESYRGRRGLMRDLLAEVPGLELSAPEGAFYFFPSYTADLPSVEMVATLRRNGVAVRPGSEFGVHGEGRLRISYAASEEAIRAGVERLSATLAEIGAG
jgi:aspartate aminotransferase